MYELMYYDGRKPAEMSKDPRIYWDDTEVRISSLESEVSRLNDIVSDIQDDTAKLKARAYSLEGKLRELQREMEGLRRDMMELDVKIRQFEKILSKLKVIARGALVILMTIAVMMLLKG